MKIVGILLIAVGIFLFLSLVSYHPVDPSFFSYTSSKVKGIHNWMGIVGVLSLRSPLPGIRISIFSRLLCSGCLCLQFHFPLGMEIPLSQIGRLVRDPNRHLFLL